MTPMHQEWFDNILDMIPTKLKMFPHSKPIIDKLFQEVAIDFDKSMKKSMGMYSNKISSLIKNILGESILKWMLIIDKKSLVAILKLILASGWQL